MLFSEPKIPQGGRGGVLYSGEASFSALQRAENSSTDAAELPVRIIPALFQCSSASRKFLNVDGRGFIYYKTTFQCSSASRKFLNVQRRLKPRSMQAVSVLFSEPKIPQGDAQLRFDTGLNVSVLFSEPKIPQAAAAGAGGSGGAFQCSSASRKFLKTPAVAALCRAALVSVLFSEPKIPQAPGAGRRG